MTATSELPVREFTSTRATTKEEVLATATTASDGSLPVVEDTFLSYSSTDTRNIEVESSDTAKYPLLPGLESYTEL